MKYGVVFSGGGSLGAWEVGAYRIIRARHDVDPVVVSGASAGALNAVAVCAQMTPDEMQRQWESLTPNKVFRFSFASAAVGLGRAAIEAIIFGARDALANCLDQRQSIFDNSPLRKTLERAFSGYEDKWAQSKISCVISLTNLQEREVHHFFKLPAGKPTPVKIRESLAWKRMDELGGVYSPLMGSAALPILFPPTANYFDGGVLLNNPALIAKDIVWPDLLYVLIPTVDTLLPVDSISKIFSSLLEAWMRVSFDRQIKDIKSYNKQNEHLPGHKLRVCIIRPSNDLTKQYSVSLLTFGKNVGKLVSDGEELPGASSSTSETTMRIHGISQLRSGPLEKLIAAKQ